MPGCVMPAAWTVTLTFATPPPIFYYCDTCRAGYPAYVREIAFWPTAEFPEFTDDLDFFDAVDVITE